MMANFRGGAIAGAIVVCYGWGEGDDQLWGSGRRAIALLADLTLFSTLITQFYQHRPQIAKTNFCVINVENSVTSARSSGQNSLLFS